ncbi:MAG: fascin domain-containing protein [Paraclostridium sordellii]
MNNNMHLMYLKYLYKSGVIEKDTYKSAVRDITDKKNKLITIKSNFNEKYVSVDGELNELAAKIDTVELSDRFILKHLDGKFLIQTEEGYYVKLDYKTKKLFAVETNKYDATKFKLNIINDKEVTLQTENNDYIQVNEDNILDAKAKTENERTKFKIKEVTKIAYDNIVIISLSQQRFVTAINGGGSYLAATEFNQTVNEEFTILQFLDNSYVIQTKGGYYVRVKDDRLLIADTKELEEASRFLGENLSGDTIILKTPDEYIVRVRDIDKYLVADAKEISDSSKFNIYMSTNPY